MVKVTGDLLTLTQAAARLKVTRQNIHAAIQRSRLKATRVGAVLLVERRAVDAYFKSRKRTGRPTKKMQSSGSILVQFAVGLYRFAIQQNLNGANDRPASILGNLSEPQAAAMQSNPVSDKGQRSCCTH